MKAVAVFPGTKTVKIVEHEAPRLSQPDQVMLRMLDIGICGTDREICSFEYGTPPRGFDYLVIGHEALAEVVEVGSAVNRLKPGTWSCQRYAAPVLIRSAALVVQDTRTIATPEILPSAESRKRMAT